MQYVRVSIDPAGESHFEDVEVPFTLVDFSPPTPPVHVSPFSPASQFGFVICPPGWEGDWHPAPRRQILFYLAGEIEIQVSDGEVRRFGPGSVTLLEDTTGKGHRSLAVGTQEAVLAAVQFPEA